MHTYTVGIGVMVSAHTLQVWVEYVTLVLVLIPKPNTGIGAGTRYWYWCIPTLKVPYFSQCSIIIKYIWSLQGNSPETTTKKATFLLAIHHKLCATKHSNGSCPFMMSRGALIARFVTTYPAVHCVFIRYMKYECFFFLLKGTLEKTDSLSALNNEDNWVYLSPTMETRARRQIFKGKVHRDGKKWFWRQ